MCLLSTLLSPLSLLSLLSLSSLSLLSPLSHMVHVCVCIVSNRPSPRARGKGGPPTPRSSYKSSARTSASITSDTDSEIFPPKKIPLFTLKKCVFCCQIRALEVRPTRERSTEIEKEGGEVGGRVSTSGIGEENWKRVEGKFLDKMINNDPPLESGPFSLSVRPSILWVCPRALSLSRIWRRFAARGAVYYSKHTHKRRRPPFSGQEASRGERFGCERDIKVRDAVNDKRRRNREIFRQLVDIFREGKTRSLQFIRFPYSCPLGAFSTLIEGEGEI